MQLKRTTNYVLSLLAITFFQLSCANSTDQNTQSSENNPTSTIEEEIESWKTELKNSGKVGEPCEGGIEEWTKNNPNVSFGMGEVKIERFDVNKDGVEDALAHFYTESCDGGNAFANFACLTYSENGAYANNKDINEEIENKVNEYLASKNLSGVRNSYLEFTGMNETLNGKFTTWMDDDANCCPSYSGEFQYNPIDFTITASHKKNEEE